MQVLVTGSRGFIGKNLVLRLEELPGFTVLRFDHETPLAALAALVGQSDAVVHLAGVNRPQDVREFSAVNTTLTTQLCEAIQSTGRHIPLLLASSIQATLDNPYAQSKRLAEEAVAELSARTGNPVMIYRLPNVFGKWCRPNYNSVVATFCHNIAHGLPVTINDPATRLCLVYIDDVVSAFIAALGEPAQGLQKSFVTPEYDITLEQLAGQIGEFKRSRETLLSERVGNGLARALYATYLSYLPTDQFAYALQRHEDQRGVFVEMLKTRDSGQFSYFTAGVGVTRGGHYHHTKSEKFLVLSGSARFSFRQVHTGESFAVDVEGQQSRVVESVPGWAHSITNTGSGDLIVMLWANEIFDPQQPDTIAL